jgi:shikimate kinase
MSYPVILGKRCWIIFEEIIKNGGMNGKGNNSVSSEGNKNVNGKGNKSNKNNNKWSNIVLIGMPGSGKSTVGACLANMLNMNFVDTDDIIRQIEKKDLKDIVNDKGRGNFLRIQEDIILRLELNNSIVATGGSVVYSEKLMNHLKKKGVIIYLKHDILELTERMGAGRRLARNRGQSIADIYNERLPLYNKYSDFIIDCTKKDIGPIAEEIVERMGLK